MKKGRLSVLFTFLFLFAAAAYAQTTFYEDVQVLDDLMEEESLVLSVEYPTPEDNVQPSLSALFEIELLTDPAGTPLEKPAKVARYFPEGPVTFRLNQLGEYTLRTSTPELRLRLSYGGRSLLVIAASDFSFHNAVNFLRVKEDAFTEVYRIEEAAPEPAPPQLDTLQTTEREETEADTLETDFTPTPVPAEAPMMDTTRINYIRKTNFSKIYGILGRHLKPVKRGDQAMDFYHMAKAYADLNDNPFMGSWISRNDFTYLPYPDPLTDTTLQEVIRYIRNEGPNDQELQTALRQDTAAQAAFLSVKDIELSYREPLAPSADQLAEISENIQVRQDNLRDPFDPSVLAAGLSDFIMARAQEEFNISFLERLRRQLQDNRFQELRILFPKTFLFFTQELELTRYKTLLPMAKQSFVRDMETMGLNFPSLLDLPKYQAQKDAPAVFNLALFYELSNLVYQGADIEEIMNRGYQRLERRQVELSKKINLQLAQRKDSLSEMQDLQREVTTLTRQLDTLGSDVTDLLLNLEIRFTEVYRDARVADRRSGSGRWTEAARRLFRDFRQDSSPRIDRFYQWFGIERMTEMDNIPANLEGRIYYERLLNKPDLQLYPEYFNNPPDSVQLTATGLELSRNLVSPSGEGQVTVIQYLSDLYRYLLGTQVRLEEFAGKIEESGVDFLLSEVEAFQARRQELITNLEQEAGHWEEVNGRKFEHQIAALRYLAGTLDFSQSLDSTWIIDSEDPAERRDQLEKGRSKLRTVLQYARTKMLELEDLSGQESPLLSSVETQLNPPRPPDEGFSEVEAFINDIQSRAGRIDRVLTSLESEYHLPLIEARQNAAFFSKGLEVTANLLHALRYDAARPDGSTDRKWIEPETFRQILADRRQRDIFMGLIYNQLSSIEGTPALSSQGVATLTSKFINILGESRVHRDSLRIKRAQGGSLKFMDYFPLVRLSVDMINDIIETPLVNDQSLFPALHDVPVISDQTLSLFENVYNKEYGYAIHNALELFKLITETDQDSSLGAKRLRNSIILYGTFVANVANARDPDDMKNALVAAALPPGSSRIKRENPFNMSINSYMSLGAGNERLTSNQIPSGDRSAAALTLSVPIGLATSWKFSPEDAYSFTFYVPLLDLGALTSFRIDPNLTAGVLPELEFENLLAPGALFFLNFPNSPFSMGSGIQYGPRLREVDITGSIVSSASWRWMFFFGVDVPIFNISTGK